MNKKVVIGIAIILIILVVVLIKTDVIDMGNNGNSIEYNQDAYGNYVMQKGYTMELIVPDTGEEVSWSSESERIATVSEKGIVTAKRTGTVDIIAVKGDKEYRFRINVVKDDSEETQEIGVNEPVIEMEQIAAKPGDENVKVAVKVNNNPGILGMSLTIKYDEDVMELTKAENGEALKGVLNLTMSKTLGSGATFVWDGVEIDSGDIKDGEILILSFDIADDAEKGSSEISMSYDEGEVIDGNLIPVDLKVINGRINIAK